MEEECDRLAEGEFHGVAYLIHLRSNREGAWLELEEKASGEIWETQFSADYLEQITQKAGSFKRYPVFLKMLLAALIGSNDSVCLDVLTSHDLETLKGKKPAKHLHTNKRYVILTYLAEFDKVHYPLPLNYLSEPSTQRLKATIRRLALFHDPTPPHQAAKQLSLLKHDNELLKLKLQTATYHNPEYTKELESLRSSLQAEAARLDSERKELETLRKQTEAEKDRISKEISTLKEKLEITESEKTKAEAKTQKLSTEMAQMQRELRELRERIKSCQIDNNSTLLAQIQHSKEQEKKAQVKIAHLENELKGLMKRVHNSRRKPSPTQSDHRSERSQRSRVSTSSRGSQRRTTNALKRSSSHRKGTVYDSDTQSSRMRKQNNPRASPFRQTALRPESNRRKPKPKNQSFKKSPPQANLLEIEGVSAQVSDTDSESRKINETMAMLRGRRGNQKPNQTRAPKQVAKPTIMEDRISSIAEMLRKSRGNTNHS